MDMRKFLFIIGFLFGQLYAQTAHIDSIRMELNGLDISLSRKFDLMTDMAWEYTYIQPDSVYSLGNRALSLARSIGDSSREAVAIGYLGLYFDVTGNREDAVEFYLKSYNRHIANKSYRDAASMLNNVGAVYFYSDDFEQALKYFEDAMALEEAHGGLYDKAGSWVNVGAVAKNMGDYVKALRYTRMGIKEYLRIGDTSNYYAFVSNLGSLYMTLNKMDSAEYYVSLPIPYNLRKNQLFSYGTNLRLLAQIYMSSDRLDEAYEVIQKSLDISYQIKNAESILSSQETMMTLFELKGEYKDAYLLRVEYDKLTDSIEGVEIMNNIAEKEAEFESKKKQMEIERLTIENEQDKQDQRNLQLFILLICAILIMTLILYNTNRKAGIKLREKNALIEDQMNEIAELAKESHHRIKNNLQSVVSILRLQSRATDSEEGKKQLQAAQERLEAISLLHQSLYSKDRFDVMDLKLFIDQLVVQIGAGNLDDDHPIRIKSEVEEIPVQAEYALPIALIINELVTNSLKYAFQENSLNPTITILVRKEEEKLYVRVEDNGEGFPEEFDFSKQHNFGYRLLQSLIRKMKGEMKISSSSGAIVDMYFERY